MPRTAAVDCGTNSIRLLVTDVDPDAGTQDDLDRRMTVVRLGEGVDATGRLSEAALARTFAAVEAYAAVIADLGAEHVRFVATSASRDADNAHEFVTGVRQRLGVEPEVVPGAEEAELSFLGATRELVGRVPGPYCVVDLGGGSTEVVVGDVVDGVPTVGAARSVDVGCVRMTERHLHGDPPTATEVDAARADVRAALDEVELTVDLTGVRTLVGLAGSVTTVAAETLGLTGYEPDRIHGSQHALPDALAACDRLLHATRAERAARGFMHPGRVDVIGAGALVWREVLERVALRSGITTVRVSEHDILDGIAWSVARG
ncbi:Ppx/GppA phosphatase family protein [Aquipuribacter sp. MA13-6]|uniref:Ppx/GppA phosphatase family protein n=1 Tax=unclassified Aquipuribacter TaxID=2635084 RepID=UPI003EE987F8